ncbi:MAG: hypothetical protein H6838_09190 [Planctomycetes bacterium]|nr:hypothetical protein [Planctomycetota bacterium]MCB9885654.1 hypothetical protein [Planctomycetota bacterium]
MSHSIRLPLVRSLSCSMLLGAAALAQVPDGYIVWGSFQGSAGNNGVYFSHPRDTTAAPIAVTGLPAALAYDPLGRRGAASLLRRPSDGKLLVGERAPAGTSVDVHLLTLQAEHVVMAQLFSVGTSAVVGEIPQMGLLPDGRVVVAATDLQPGGPLSQFLTAGYNYEGIGILDTDSGGVVPVAISNLNLFPGVINALAVSRDGQTIYVGNYISALAGDLWAVPTAGGAATMVASLPAGASNLTVDQDGTVLVTTLNGPPNLFRFDPATQTTTPVTTASGPLNAIGVERATGNLFLATANGGVPARSLLWMEPSGVEHNLISPNMATISSIDSNPNPEAYGAGTAGVRAYDWQLAPNPGGLPEVGNLNFSLTVAASQPTIDPLLFLMSLGASAPTPMFGLDVLVDLSVTTTTFTTLVDRATQPFPLPAVAGLVGIELFAQAFVLETQSNTLAASPGVAFTIL